MNLFRKPGSQNWYYRFNIHGRRYQASTGTANKRDAETAMRRAWAEIEAAAPKASPLIPPLTVLRDLDVKRAESNGRHQGYIDQAIKANWGHLAAFFENVSKVTLDALQAYVRHRQAQKVRNQTIMKELTCLKRGLTLGLAAGLPITPVVLWPKLSRSPKDKNRSGKSYEPKQIRKWLAELSGEARDVALLVMLTGVRGDKSGEVYKITPSHLQPARYNKKLAGVLHLTEQDVKAGPERFIGLNSVSREIIERATPFRSVHKTAFTTAAKRAGLPRVVTLRDLRANFATAADGCGDTRAVDLVMGHGGGETAMRYQKNTEDRMAAVLTAVETWLKYP